jgi:hypothetical protein
LQRAAFTPDTASEAIATTDTVGEEVAIDVRGDWMATVGAV